jgi:NADH:ubiquinone oxidoreductase subunit 5 (subunit L)/multisubunit Na+/H+ antiporter MnhA subunit
MTPYILLDNDVFIISCLVILYRDDYMFGDLNIVRFIVLVLMFVISIIFLIVRLG